MATQFEEGRYLVRIIDQCFTESPQKGTLGFSLAFRVVKNLDEPDAPIKSTHRGLTMWISEKNVSRVLHDLHTLGYEGSTLAGVDPDAEDVHDFRDTEVEMVCAHEDGFERWSLRATKQHLKDKSKLRELDRVLNPKRPTGGTPDEASHEITDSDIPF